MILAGTLGNKVGSSPMATAKPIVFVVDDDVWIRESLQTLVQDEGWHSETFASAQQFLDPAGLCSELSRASTFPSQASMVSNCRSALPSNGGTCRSSS